ncbi:hypothetical protein [Bacillus sp. Hm123]|uniref:hypothetical protein n=1 Tax=Bacillus sp. Hm123 TaxID=3450745 RepID=UPI003F433F91
METLVVYDESGYILSIKSGTSMLREPIGVPYLWVDVPKNKRIKIVDGVGVDVSTTPHQAILEDIPPTETQLLQQQVNEQKQAIAELTLMLATSN